MNYSLNVPAQPHCISHYVVFPLGLRTWFAASSSLRYEDLWGKVVDGLLQVNASAADWFVKADDDTFLLYPNLIELLAPLDPSEPVYLGLSLIYRPEVGSIP